MPLISKADILAGKDKVEHVFVEELNGDIQLRPLTSKEFALYQEQLMKGIKISGKASIEDLNQGLINLKDMNVGNFMLNNAEAAYIALSKSIVPAEGEEPWTPEEVSRLPHPVIDKLMPTVLRISGVTKQMEEATKNFRKGLKANK